MNPRHPHAFGVAALLASLLTGTLASAVDFTCPTDGSAAPWRKTRTFFDPPRSEWSSLSDTLCEVDSAGNCTDIKLRGYLYLPDGNVADSRKDMPLIVHNHGSGRAVSDHCEMAAYFNRHGYALFIPHRRGHGSSTGLNDSDFTALCPPGICDAVTRHLRLLDYLDQQNFEVRKAIDFMRGLRNSAGERIIDPEKIAIVGHSFGGMLALFNNVKLSAPKVVIPIAPASESWRAFDREDGTGDDNDSPSIRTLKVAAVGGRAPMFFLEPTNDVNINPIFVLSQTTGAGLWPLAWPLRPAREVQAALFPAVPLADGEDSTNAHVHFVLDHDQVLAWAPAVREFMARHGVK